MQHPRRSWAGVWLKELSPLRYDATLWVGPGGQDADEHGLERLGCGEDASAALLALGAGAVVPLLTGAAIAEAILTNEVAIAALAIGVVTLSQHG
jgi:hypothetical protein